MICSFACALRVCELDRIPMTDVQLSVETGTGMTQFFFAVGSL